MRRLRRTIAVVIGAIPCIFALTGCAAQSGAGASITPTVEPLTEVEFDAFADEVADQLVAWLERTQSQLPVRIAGPAIDQNCAENRGVARAFSVRLAEGLNDRLGGAVRFAGASVSKPRLRSELAFAHSRGGGQERTLEFRLWDAEANTEFCRWACSYGARPRRLEGVPATTNRRHAKSGGSVQPPTGAGAPSPAAAPRDAARGVRPRRTIKIDSHEDGLGKLLVEQSEHYDDRTLRGQNGKIVFLDRSSWERLNVRQAKVKRTESGRLRVMVHLQAHDHPQHADIRIIYFDKIGRQLEASAVRTVELSPRFARPLALTSSKPGATRYVMLVARG